MVNNLPIQPICSLCVLPAAYRCCTKQQLDKTGIACKVGEESRGCGLLVCLDCHKVMERHRGLLEQATTIAGAHDDSRRADLEFLFKGSLLHEAYGLCKSNGRRTEYRADRFRMIDTASPTRAAINNATFRVQAKMTGTCTCCTLSQSLS